MTISEMKEFKEKNEISYDILSKYSGVPASTIFKIFQGASGKPRKRTLDALEGGIQRLKVSLSLKGSYGEWTKPDLNTSMVSESARSYRTYPEYDYSSAYGAGHTVKKDPQHLYINNPDGSHVWPNQGSYTIEDLRHLPESLPVELIDGNIIEMEAPSFAHQKCAGFLYNKLSDAIEEAGEDCETFIAPIDVQLTENDSDIVEPDVGIVCDRSRITGHGIVGAPDFIAEILSPSTRRRDMTLKAWLYARAGVQLYWMIDPEKEQIIIHDFAHGDALSIHTFDETVDFCLHEKQLSIDFSRLKIQLGKLRQEK